MTLNIPTGNGRSVTLTLKTVLSVMALVGGLFSAVTWVASSVVWAGDFYEYKVGSEASMNAIQIDIVEERLYRARKYDASQEEVDRYARKLDRLEQRQEFLEQKQLELQAPVRE